MNKVITKEIDLDGRKLTLETGKLAQLTEAAVLTTWGETVVLVTVATRSGDTGLDYFPLSVEYVEKYYAGGRITGQRFVKRESRPSEKAILSGRAIDRSIRPLFPKDFKAEVQIIITVLSYDSVNDPVTLGLIGTSAALSMSSIPWAGPLGVTRLGLKDGITVLNPQLPDLEELDLDVLVASTRTAVAMIEAEAKQVADDTVYKAIKDAHEHAQPIIDLIEDFVKEAGKTKQVYAALASTVDETVMKDAKKEVKEKIEAALFDKEHAWHEATGEMIKSDLVAAYKDRLTASQVNGIFDKVAKEIMNDTILNKGKRVDGRAMDEIRPIEIETGLLPRTHGSAVFKRGDTQVLSITTLGPMSASQTLEGMEGERSKRFMHHYNMSINPFSVGEPKRMGPPNRRDIGHGDLVERSLVNALPSEEDFPYAMRVVSEIMAANASTSMASTAASTLSLLNAGVKIEPVAGIALGLLSNEEKFQVITDMRAVEDFYGEMDFKVTGTKNGVTAIQMDTKLHGLSFEIIEEAMKQGKQARETILAEINKATPEVGEISQYAPKIEVTHIKPEEIGLLIGPGGKNINGIIAKTGAQIDIEDDGTVMVSSMDEDAIKQAMDAITGMFKKIAPGEIYDGKVVRIVPFGAFVELVPGKDGLVHVSQMATERVENPEDVVQEGQTIKVRVLDVDSQGKVSLSMLFGADAEARGASRDDRRSDGGDRGGASRRPFGGNSDRPRTNFGSRGRKPR